MLPRIRASKLRDFRLLHKVETETSCSPVSQRKGVVFVAKLWTFFTQSLTAESWSSPASYCGANSLLDFKSRWIFIKNTFILMGQYFIKFLILHICCKGFPALSSINSLFRKTHTHKNHLSTEISADVIVVDSFHHWLPSSLMIKPDMF